MSAACANSNACGPETRAADGEAPKLTRDAALPAWAPAYESSPAFSTGGDELLSSGVSAVTNLMAGIHTTAHTPRLVGAMRASSCRQAAGLAALGTCALLIAACGSGGHRTVAAGDGCHTETLRAAASPA